MMTMLSPDLLDRRALALIRLVDVFGRPVASRVRVEGDGVASTAKGDGAFAILVVPGLEAHSSSFMAPPSSPALRSRHVPLDLTPASREVASRRFDLRLPRDPNPDHADSDASLFRSIEVEMLPTAQATASGSACVLRVSVTRKDDGRAIENALVRARSDNGQFTARTMTDARGEASLVFPSLPLAFPAGDANLRPEIAARVVVTVDPAVARFHAADEIAAAATAAALRRTNHPDPDALAAGDADFGAGDPVNLAAGRQPSLSIQWKAA